MTAKRFILGLTIGSLVALAIHEARAAEWDTTDKILFGSFVGLQVIDTAQTWKIHSHRDEYRETNSIYGSDPNMGLVIGLKTAVTGGIYYITRDMPSGERKFLLTLVDAIQLSVVAHNYSIGLKYGF